MGKNKIQQPVENEELKMPEDASIVDVNAGVPASEEKTGHTVVIILAGILAAVVLLGVGAYLYIKNQNVSSEVNQELDAVQLAAEIEKEPFTYLMKNNTYFEAGQNALSAQKYSEARNYFDSALTLAKTPAERGQIQYKLAIAESWDKEPVMAIRRLKQIVLDEEYSDQQRAYAIMRIGEIYYGFNSEEVVNEIFFADDFFQQQFTQDDGASSIAFIRMYEYGGSFKLLAVSELRRARFYTRLINNLESKETITEADQRKIDDYYQTIYTALANADADYEATKDIDNAGGLGPRILVFRATLLGGLAEHEKESTETAIKAFEDALVATQIAEGSDGQLRYQYARFLMRNGGDEHAERINDLLLPFGIERDVYSNMLDFFAKHANDNPLGSRPTLVGLGKISSQFASLLVELGYPPSEFVVND